MKKLSFFAAVVAAALLAVSSNEPVRAGQNYPEPCDGILPPSASIKYSSLCDGLSEHYGFEEDSDSDRYGAFMSALMEPGAKNVARIPSPKSLGLYALDLENSAGENQQLWQLGGLSAPYTVAMWIKPESLPSTVGAKVSLVSVSTLDSPGPQLYLETTSATGPVAKVCLSNKEQETGTTVTVCSANGSIAVAINYHIVAGESEHLTGKARLFLALNGVSVTPSAAGYFTEAGIAIIDIGAHRDQYADGPINQYYDGVIDQLLFYGRALPQADINLLYGGGAGIQYPFDTE